MKKRLEDHVKPADNCTYCTGRKGEDIAQRKLWNYGYKVKNCADGGLFDLLIDDSIRVEVKSTSRFTLMKDGRLSWTVPSPNNKEWDALILVLPAPFEKPIVIFTSKEEYVEKTNIFGGGLTIKSDLKGIVGWHNSPFDVFPRPLLSLKSKKRG